ncbi:permease-like cell division protein FtsX [Antrihabitans cavernicola]|uniref:FtsX extracellular domain-containing protein n=1 Tax=Antrihabitans cavernicola TaxID=2495913 RepID=A0A5A7SB04_9NOCA|nr:permease-like cell division protein FtsX [Spelaeibacter cavernicola]KAA0022479.1 hypothetical protein FOY51_12270 [Spelaeibacter cavernicola]
MSAKFEATVDLSKGVSADDPACEKSACANLKMALGRFAGVTSVIYSSPAEVLNDFNRRNPQFSDFVDPDTFPGEFTVLLETKADYEALNRTLRDNPTIGDVVVDPAK